MSEFIWHWTKGSSKIYTKKTDIAEKAMKEGMLVMGIRAKPKIIRYQKIRRAFLKADLRGVYFSTEVFQIVTVLAPDNMSDLDYKKLLKKVLDDASTKKVVEDRFKLPKVEILYEGNTTVIKNFDKISIAVNREPDLILKFLLGWLGTSGEINGGRVTFQGKIPPKQVQDKLKDYIDTYVICSECNRPDTHIVKQGRTHLIRCDACGAFRSVKSIKKKPLQQSVEALKEGTVYDLTIKDIGRKGDGVAYFDKYVVYVPGAVKGATIKVKIEKISGTVAFGHVVEV